MTSRPCFTAIVTDGLWRKSLSAIRSLGKAGFHVGVMGDSIFTTGFWSRYTSQRFIAPTADHNPEEFGKALINALSNLPSSAKSPVILPMEEGSLIWISENFQKLNTLCCVLLPNQESLNIALNKGKTIQLATQTGVATPQTFDPQNFSEFLKIIKQFKPGKFVIKPVYGKGSQGIIYGDKHHTDEFWHKYWNHHGPALVQERIPPEGQSQGVSLLMDKDSKCIAAFAHERLQQYPNSGGPSTDRQSILAPGLIEQSLAILKPLKWQGIAMVEWKTDPRDGKPKLMEINPRFWGSLELAIRAGVDFPTLYARAALGENVAPQFQYKPGIRCRWMIPGEFLRYCTQTSSQREPLRKFITGLPAIAEEWDLTDLRGCASTLICTVALALNPRYWKYVRRG